MWIICTGPPSSILYTDSIFSSLPGVEFFVLVGFGGAVSPGNCLELWSSLSSQSSTRWDFGYVSPCPASSVLTNGLLRECSAYYYLMELNVIMLLWLGRTTAVFTSHSLPLPTELRRLWHSVSVLSSARRLRPCKAFSPISFFCLIVYSTDPTINVRTFA